MTEEQDNIEAADIATEPVTEEDLDEAVVAAEPEGETCSNCRHEFQLQCQLISKPGKPRTVKPDGHCSRWE